MKKTGFLFFVLILGHIKALELDVALASLEVNLNQLFEPNISLFYDSSLKALNDAYTAAFGKLVNVGALGQESFKNKDADYQFQQGFVIEVEDEKQLQALTDEFNTLEKNLKKALDDYQVMFGLSMQKTEEPKQEDDLSSLALYLISPLEQARTLVTVKQEPEPPVWARITDIATGTATLNAIKAGMANVDQAAANDYLVQFKRDKDAIANTLDVEVYGLAKEVARLLKNISSADKANEWDEIIKVF